MTQTAEGAMKVRARKTGLSVSQYQRKIINEKWCSGCKDWHFRSIFPPDSTRADGLAAYCSDSRNRNRRGTPRRAQPRNQVRAHRLIQMRVLRATLPNPNMCPCLDCGHLGDNRRHEYDHYLGYDTPEARATVQTVCSVCHRARERRRRGGK